MSCVTKFHTLLLLWYFFNIISDISGNETPEPSSDSNGNVVNMTTTNPSLSSNHGRENTLHSGFSEGGLTDTLTSTKLNNFPTIRAKVEEESTIANDRKGPNLTLSSVLYSLEEPGPSSTHSHVSKPRKGVNNNDSHSEETLIGLNGLGHSEISKKEPNLKHSFNDTSNTSTLSNIVSNVIKTSTDFLSSTVSSINLSSKNDESEKNVNTSSSEEKDNLRNSTGVPVMPFSTAISKPKFTRIDGDTDEKSSFSFSSESDYVIPIVALIFAAPLLAILGMVLYKRSKEFWERRHYRRMDFLIDGMYND